MAKQSKQKNRPAPEQPQNETETQPGTVTETEAEQVQEPAQDAPTAELPPGTDAGEAGGEIVTWPGIEQLGHDTAVMAVAADEDAKALTSLSAEATGLVANQAHGLQSVGLVEAPESAAPVESLAGVAGQTPGTIDAVLAALPGKAPCGSIITRPETILPGELAELQNRIYLVLVDQGQTLRSQGDVYAWLLGQIRDALLS